ncbi:MAG: hypothetical protein J2P37_03755, partial [Ktedonobacteraceae bacterium]|nr:hypothetical protein [Ktedonobacteraceae bacterium]
WLFPHTSLPYSPSIGQTGVVLLLAERMGIKSTELKVAYLPTSNYVKAIHSFKQNTRGRAFPF